MKEGDIVLTPIPQADGVIKYRPALVLRQMPPFQDLLVCGISTQTHQIVQNFDEIISPEDPDFGKSGLLTKPLIRFGYLAIIPRKNIAGSIGLVNPDRHTRLLINLSTYLVQNVVSPK